MKKNFKILSITFLTIETILTIFNFILAIQIRTIKLSNSPEALALMFLIPIEFVLIGINIIFITYTFIITLKKLDKKIFYLIIHLIFLILSITSILLIYL